MTHTDTTENIAQEMNIWVKRARADYVANIGQLSRDDIRDLDVAVKCGFLVKHRGYWNTGVSEGGIGPLKTIWRGA